MGNSLEKRRNVYMDFLRIVAAFFVIANHINNPLIFYNDVSKSWYASIIFFFICKVAVPIFMMISGSLLLKKTDDMHKYFTRIFRWICIIFIFSTVYYIYFFHDKEFDIIHYLKSVLGGSTIAYWYLFLYLGILIVLPILQRIAQTISKKEIELVLFISLFLAGTIPVITLFSGINIEGTFLDAIISPYWGMLFAGYYIDNYVVLTRKLVIKSSILFVVLVGLQVVITRGLYEVDNHNYMLLDDRTFVFITVSAVCIYIIIKYIFENIKLPSGCVKVISYMGELTLGVFLLGDLFTNILMPVFVKYCSFVNVFIALFVFSVCSFCCSMCFTVLLKHIPFVRKLL